MKREWKKYLDHRNPNKYWTPLTKKGKTMAELRDEHFEVISENKARRYEKDKKELQHQVMDLEMAIHKIKEVIREYEKSNDNK